MLIAVFSLAAAAAAAPDLAPLLGEWRNVSPADPGTIRPGATLDVEPGRIRVNGVTESIRQVHRRGDYVAVQTGIRAVYQFRLVGPDRICRVYLGNGNPVPTVSAFGDNEPVVLPGDCYVRAAPDG